MLLAPSSSELLCAWIRMHAQRRRRSAWASKQRCFLALKPKRPPAACCWLLAIYWQYWEVDFGAGKPEVFWGDILPHLPW